LNLTPKWRAVLVERQRNAAPRIGEALPPAARRLLTDMGLFASFQMQGHAPCYGNRSVWGASEPVETDFLRDPHGHGWHLDRARFDGWLRSLAVASGALLLAPARIDTIDRARGRWSIVVARADRPILVRASFLIDAGGRAAPLARRLGARRRACDRLICGFSEGQADATGRGNGITFVEATAQGWWYTAPLPGRRRILAFHTDADLPAARVVRDHDRLIAAATSLGELGALLSECGFRPTDRCGVTAAHGAVLRPCAGIGWVAAGDAALAFDPISAQGLLNALVTGLAAAETTDRALSGGTDTSADYAQTIDAIEQAYRRHRAGAYRAETRWPESAFWQRRHRS
jgi:flavin-dependent dehydrogenase